MGKSNSQVVGYRYSAKFAAFIGNRIEKFLGINFDNRGWILHDPTKHPPNLLPVQKPNLYGETEGGVSGNIDIHFGTPDQEPNAEYQKYFPLVSGYPYQSYLVFRGEGEADFSGIGGIYEEVANILGTGGKSAFYVGNSGYMKEMLLWVKRIHVKNNGDVQWYDNKAEVPELPQEFSALLPELQSSIQSTYLLQYWSEGEEKFKVWNGYTFASNNVDLERLASMSGIGKTGPSDESENVTTTQGDGYTFTTDALMTLFVSVSSVAKDISFTLSGNIIRHESTKSKYITSNGYEAFKLNILIVFRRQIFIKIHASGGVVKEGGTAYLLNVETGISAKLASESDLKVVSGDINPVHKIREILTDDIAMGKPESDVNEVSFMKAANQIWDEGLGVSWAIDEKSCVEAIEELCYHIEAGIRVNRQTGLYEMVLFRDNWFAEDEIHNITESKIKDLTLEVMNSDDIVNQLNVTYYDRQRIKNSTFSVYENGSILTMGHANAESIDFPYFMNMRNAEIVANWKLKQLSTPAWSGSFTTGWKEARKWNRYDLIRLPWSKKWNGTILVRIIKINLGNGTDNTVTIDFEEVIPYSGEMNTSIVVDAPVESAPQPPQPCQYEPFELPYYLAVMALGQRQVDDELAYESNFGLVGVVAEQPQSNSLYAIMKTHNGVEGEEWLRAASIQYSETADLDQILSKTSSNFTVKNWKKLANVSAGTLIKCGRDWLGTPGEWMVFQGIDPYTGIISVKRGALDTPPQEWGVDSKLYFCGDDIAYDANEYVLGEEILVSALTTTPSGVLEQKGSIPVEIQARAIRPYPPANVKINGEYWPKKIRGDWEITWVDRNRLQQTGGSILSWFDSGVTIEAGVSTYLVLTEFDKNGSQITTANFDVSNMNQFLLQASSLHVDTDSIEFKLLTERDGYECLNPVVINLSTDRLVAPSDLTVEFIEGPLVAPSNLTALYRQGGDVEIGTTPDLLLTTNHFNGSMDLFLE